MDQIICDKCPPEADKKEIGIKNKVDFRIQGIMTECRIIKDKLSTDLFETCHCFDQSNYMCCLNLRMERFCTSTKSKRKEGLNQKEKLVDKTNQRVNDQNYLI